MLKKLEICENCKHYEVPMAIEEEDTEDELKKICGKETVDSFLDLEYKEIILKILGPNEEGDNISKDKKEAFSGCIEYSPKLRKEPEIKYFDKVILARNEFEFIKSKKKLIFILSLLISNLVVNILLYINYAGFESETKTIIFREEIALETIFFPIILVVIVFSSGILFRYFVYLKSLRLARFMKYLGVVEFLGFIGLVTDMFWAAIFTWSAFIVYFWISFDISSLKPNKRLQLEYSKELIAEQNQSQQQPKKSRKFKWGKNNN